MENANKEICDVKENTQTLKTWHLFRQERWSQLKIPMITEVKVTSLCMHCQRFVIALFYKDLIQNFDISQLELD